MEGPFSKPSDLKPESSGIRNLTNFTHSQMFASFYPPKKGNGGTRVTSHDVSSLCQIFEPLTSSIEKNHHKSNHHHLNTCGLPTQPTNSCSNLSEWNGIIFQSQIMGGHFRNRFPIHSPHFIPWRSESLGCPCTLPVMKTLKKRESAAGNRRCPQWVWGCWLINHGRLKCFTDKLFFCQALFRHEITLLTLRRNDSALIVWTLRCSFAKRRHTKPRNNLYEPKREIQIVSRLLLWSKHIFSVCTIFGGSKSPQVGISDPRPNVNGNLESRFSGWQLIGVKQDWILKPQTWWIAPKLNMCFMVPIVQFIISKLMQVIIFKSTRLKSLQIANGKHPAPPGWSTFHIDMVDFGPITMPQPNQYTNLLNRMGNVGASKKKPPIAVDEFPPFSVEHQWKPMGNENRKNPHQNSNIYCEVLILECSWLFRWIDICIEKVSFQPRNDVIAFCFCVDFSTWNSFSWTYTLHDANWLPSNTHNYPARKHARILTPAFLNKCNIQGPLPTQTMHFLRATASTKLPSALFDPRKTQMDILIICK